jgi:hypothetical protein
MGVIKKGILGGFQGKVGTGIGSFWKGKAVMRSVPASVSNPRTDAQVGQRAKFKLAAQFCALILEAIQNGWRGYAKQITSSNAIMSDMLKDSAAFKVDGTIDFAKVHVSKGQYYAIDFNSTGLSQSATTVDVDFSKPDRANDDDLVYAVVFNETQNEAIVNSDTADQNSISCSRPSTWITGNKVHAWLFVYAQNLKKGPVKSISNSIYVGESTL